MLTLCGWTATTCPQTRRVDVIPLILDALSDARGRLRPCVGELGGQRMRRPRRRGGGPAPDPRNLLARRPRAHRHGTRDRVPLPPARPALDPTRGPGTVDGDLRVADDRPPTSRPTFATACSRSFRAWGLLAHARRPRLLGPGNVDCRVARPRDGRFVRLVDSRRGPSSTWHCRRLNAPVRMTRSRPDQDRCNSRHYRPVCPGSPQRVPCHQRPHTGRTGAMPGGPVG